MARFFSAAAHTAGMAIPHVVSGEPVDVRPLGNRLAQGQTHALFKTEGLEVIRLVLPQGKSMPPHAVAGEITVHCLEGQIDIQTDARSQVLEAGQLLYLAGGVTHSLVSLADATALLTIVLRK